MSRGEEEEEEEAPRHKRGKRGAKRWLKIVSIGLIVVLSILGILYLAEKSTNANIADRYTMCLSQNRVLDERFADCSVKLQGCMQNSGSCTGT
jgi:flagellar basal body-associated protein FliL